MINSLNERIPIIIKTKSKVYDVAQFYCPHLGGVLSCNSFAVLNSRQRGTLIKVYGDINPMARRRQLESARDVTMQRSPSLSLGT